METLFPWQHMIELPKMFKSYYVVWKHEVLIKKQKKIICLNRTMQYGNNTKKKMAKHKQTV